MRKRPSIRIALAAAALAVGLAASASAAPPVEKAAKKKPAPEAPSGLHVAIDPVTGQVRQPTPEELQALSSDFARTLLSVKSVPQATYWADGTVSLVLGADHLNATVLRVNSDGTTSEVCVAGLEQAAALVAAGGAALEEK